MKTRSLIAIAMVGLALSFTPALAQRGGRGGGGGSRGGGGHSSSMSSSRGSYGGGSSSRSTGSYSAPSSSSRSSYSSSPSSPSRPSASAPSRSNASAPAPARGSYSGTPAGTRGSHAGAPAGTRGSHAGAPAGTRGSHAGAPAGTRGSHAGAPAGTRGGSHAGAPAGTRGAGAPSTSSHGTAVHNTPGNPGHHGGAGTGYARPGHPGALPPSHRPIHPAPYFYHPWHGYMVHCHPIYWDPIAPRLWYWPGFWHYCHSYWYDYHVTDVVVVRDYVRNTYNVDIVTYGISGDIMYAIVRDGGDTYLQVYDNSDHLLAEQKINRKYCNMVIDPENGGCWISKPGDKDPLLFIWAEGQLLIYEAD